jgi:hypothetical protein
VADLGVEGGDLGIECADYRHQRDGDLPARLALPDLAGNCPRPAR